MDYSVDRGYPSRFHYHHKHHDTVTARALVVGVPRTEWAGLPPLDGVIEDVSRVEQELRARGFAVTVLSDQLHAEAVKVALKQAAADTTPGDLTVIYLSGHGFRLPDTSGDEVDRWDEAFVCADEPIPDDWFRSEFWPSVNPDTRFVTIVDACHSDTAVLGLRAQDSVVPAPVTKPLATNSWRLVLAACRDEESALDLGRGDAGGGVVTTEMLGILAADPAATHRSLWTRVAANVRDRFASSGVGTPRLSSSGPDDSLLDALALAPLSERADSN